MKRLPLPAAVILTVLTARADDWPRFRGPDGGAASAKSLPLRWGDAENVRWKTPIPGEGTSSPVVWNDRIYLTSAENEGTRRLVHCLDRDNGKVLWSRGVKDDDPERTSAVTGHAAATPVTDGKRVVAFFGNAGAVCYDAGGKQLWHRKFGAFDTELGLASSPVLYKDRVILVCDHDGNRFTTFDSFLIALDLATGKDVWKTERRGLERSWGTPLLVPAAGGKRELVVPGMDHLRGYDPRTGKELWRCAGLTGWVAPSPVYAHGLVFAVSGKNGPVLAVKPGGRGEVKPVWIHQTGGPYVCSPVVYGDLLYVADEHGFLTCYDARTGKRQYRERLGGKCTSSPIAGAGRVYCTNEDGDTFVIAAGPRFKLLAKNSLKETVLASPVVSRGEFLYRGAKHLFCITSPKKP